MVTEQEVWDARSDPDSFKAKYGEKHWKKAIDEGNQAFSSLPSGTHTAQEISATLKGLKDSKPYATR